MCAVEAQSRARGRISISRIRKSALSTSGGDAPGLNAVIRAVVLASLKRGLECVGIREGYTGLLMPENFPNGGLVPLTRESVSGITSGTGVENTTRQTIVRNGIVSQIADGIRDGVFAPPKQYQFLHYHLDGGAAITTNPLQITMNHHHTLLVDAVEAIRRFKLDVSIVPPGSLTVTLLPPQPADGYEEGTVVTGLPHENTLQPRNQRRRPYIHSSRTARTVLGGVACRRNRSASYHG